MTAAEGDGRSGGDEPKLLAGGNPQIPKGDGDEELVASWIEQASQLPGWVP